VTDPAAVLLATGWLLGWLLAGRRHQLPSAPDGAIAACRPRHPLGPDVVGGEVGGLGASQRGASVSVVVPARDEAERLPRLLDGLVGSVPEEMIEEMIDEVIVVDDGSSDGTADVARARGVRVITTDVPVGWTGKAHACARGAAAAHGDVLVFLDADVEPRGPRGSVVADLATAAATTGGIVSAHPVHRVERVYERPSAGPGVVALLAAGTGGPTARRWWRGAFAFGPALAVPADVYRRIGGHAAVRGSVVDDVALARRAAAMGVPVAAYLGGPQLTYRMYPGGLGRLIEGWTKNLAAGGATTPPLRLAAVVAWVAATLQAGLGLVGGGPLLVAIAVYGLFAIQFHVLARRIGDFGVATAALFPLVILAFVGLFAGSVALAAGPGRVRWRGRVVSVGRAR
jgi:4,4'-diaponeurosporenoate glycosyltransferase